MASSRGWSKGCNTCRKRKKGCDLNRPYCHRCLKERRVCEGYERATVFVQHKPDKSSGSTRLTQSRSNTDCRKTSGFKSVPVAAVLHPALARSAFGQQCASFWWAAYVPEAAGHSSVAKTSQTYWSAPAWAETITRMSNSCAVLRKALYALSLSSAGCQEQNKALNREGQKYYGETLVQLGQLLQHPGLAAEDESLLATCLLLADYEFFNGCSPPEHSRRGENWHVHVEGFHRLLQLRNRCWKCHATDASIVLQAFRKLQLSLSFGRQRAWPPDKVEWSDVIESEEDKPPTEKLRDILMPVPGLLEATYNTQLGSSEERQKVFQGLTGVYKQLRCWKGRLGLRHFGSGENSDPEFLLDLGLDVAHSCMLYWSACLAIHNAAEKLRLDQLVDAAFTCGQSVMVLPDRDLNARKENIVSAAKLLLRPEAGLTGIINVCLPIGILIRFDIARREDSEEELKLLIDALVDVIRLGPLAPMNENLIKRICVRSAIVNGSGP